MDKRLFVAASVALVGASSALADRFTLQATIYDSDADLHPAFSCFSQGGEGCQFGAAQDVGLETARTAINFCFGIKPGMVENVLDSVTKKPTLTTAGKKCFIDEKYFNQLFNYTEGVNEKTLFDIPFEQTDDDQLLFDSDFYISPGTVAQGGFYPAELSTDSSVVATDSTQQPVAAARTKRTAEGPVFFGPSLLEIDPLAGESQIDVLCNGPAWDNGFDCQNQFVDGAEEEEFIQTNLRLSRNLPSGCVLGWSCPDQAPEGWKFYEESSETMVEGLGSVRWYSKTGRNQHFCLEAHTQFSYRPGVKFSFRSSDDLWVFIDNKLAVDLGGTHMTAPGYVDMKHFKGVSGEFKAGEKYDLDIFFCDRRTTMNSLRIKTNAFTEEAVGVKARSVAAKAFNAFAQGNSIAIAMDNNSAAKYTILNSLGSVVRSGNLQQGRAVVPALTSGSYIVKVGPATRLVTVR